MFDMNQRIAGFDDEVAFAIQGENRRGETVLHPLPTLSIAVIRVRPGEFESHRDLADWLAGTKAMAKRQAGHSLFVEQRRPNTLSESG